MHSLIVWTHSKENVIQLIGLQEILKYVSTARSRIKSFKKLLKGLLKNAHLKEYLIKIINMGQRTFDSELSIQQHPAEPVAKPK